MGYSSTDGPSGKGLGSFTNTPSTTSDLNKLLELVGRMGNLRVGTTATRTALTGSSLYEGLHFYDTTLNDLWVYDGAAWVTGYDDDGYTNVSTFSPFWSATAGYTPRVRRVGQRIDLYGAATAAAGAGADGGIITVPSGFRPTGNVWIGPFRSSGGLSGMLVVSSAGVVSAPNAYVTGSLGAGSVVPFVGSWYVD